MRCLRPRKVGFQTDGATIAWSYKNSSKEYDLFQLPCGKCIECRLEYARQWAVRCVHESKVHPYNCFVTLTYKDLSSPRLEYSDFQSFLKKLRDQRFREVTELSFGKGFWSSLNSAERRSHLRASEDLYSKFRIGVFVTGEYGELKKRPHWHAILFNYRPSDCVPWCKNENGDQMYTSKSLDALWGHNDAEKAPTLIGDVTFQSAGYVARYAAKKLVHGKDQDHDFHPISKKSSKHAIGKAWLEKFWKDVFVRGEIVLPDGSKCGVPRYYEKWLKKERPEDWLCYMRLVKLRKCALYQAKAEKEAAEYRLEDSKRDYFRDGPLVRPDQVKEIILEDRFKRLQSHLKGRE